MTKRTTIAALLCAVTAGAYAAPLTPEQALSRASGMEGKMMKSASTMRLAKTVSTPSGTASAYIFVPASGEGFSILGADDMTVPVIGYSATGKFDADNIPPSLEWWLNETGRRLEWLAAKGVEVTPAIYAPADMTAVEPMLTTRWNQDAPYNNMTPQINGVQTPTGCVATSFAQVMNYFKYPEKGRGTVQYTWNGQRLSIQLTKTPFDWDNMLNEYTKGKYNDAEADAVATLMKACGYSLEMNYGVSASGAQSYKLVNAAINNFRYDPGTRYEERQFWSPVAWTRMVYDNLKNVGPVIYDGSSLSGGHSFVCDGYDGNGYFHFNWGWGGISDGWYLLDALNPESQGIGGAEGGFNYSQGIVLGMQKPVEGSVQYDPDKMRIYGSARGVLGGGRTLQFEATEADPAGWGNGCYHSISVVPGVIISDAATGEVVENVAGTMRYADGGDMPRVSLNIYTYFRADAVSPVVEIPEGLADGRYKVTLAARAYSDEEAEWVPMVCDWGASNYCYLTVAGSALTVENVSLSELTFTTSEITSPLYMNRNFRLSSTITNNSDVPLSLVYYPALARDGVVQFQGDYMLVSVNPGETIVKEAPVLLYTADGATDTGIGTYTLQIYDRESGELIGNFGEYEMDYVNGSLQITLDGLSVEGATQKDHQVAGRTFKDVYVVESNPGDVKVNFDYTVKRGYLDRAVRLAVNEYVPDTKDWNLWDNNIFYEVPFIGPGTEQKEVVSVDFSGHDLSTVYRIRAYYTANNGQSESLGYIYVGFENSGVDGIEADMLGSDVEYFTLQGVRIDSPAKGQVVIRKAGSKVEKIVY